MSSVSLKRLTPTTKDLGCLRLWQDDIEEIVLLVRQQLSNETIVLESDGNELEDVAVDLPKLGRRVQYFTVKVTGKPEDDGEGPRNVLTLNLTRDRCEIEATNPDAGTRGVISDIQNIAQRCRRVPLWYPHDYFSVTTFSTSSLVTASRIDVNVLALCSLMLLIASAVGTMIGALSIPGILTFGSSLYRLPLSESTAILVPSAIVLIVLSVGVILSRTILFTGTRKDAPTFWQQNRASIVIGVVVAAVFYLLGLWTANV